MFKFDENSNYKLTKIRIKDFTSNRYVLAGDSFTGVVSITNNNSLMVSRGVQYLRTSPVVNVQDQENGNYLVETKNSIYSLEKLNNENN